MTDGMAWNGGGEGIKKEFVFAWEKRRGLCGGGKGRERERERERTQVNYNTSYQQKRFIHIQTKIFKQL